jgi:GrpB-like predicted nucleotidyltransferase (UPF0157 family)
MHSEIKTQLLLEPYYANWTFQFQTEASTVHRILGAHCHGIHHIGSTAIPGIYAQPIIDILVVVNNIAAIELLNPAFEGIGYSCTGEHNIEGRRHYYKGEHPHYSHQLHVFEQGHLDIQRHLAFRDYLLKHHDTAQGYSWIKRGLAKQFPTNKEAYIQGKESFIQMIHYNAGVTTEAQNNAVDEIVLKPYDPNWPRLAAAEIDSIKQSARLPFVEIEHFGSTSVEGLTAKPLIDIVIALDDPTDAQQWIKPLTNLGYINWNAKSNIHHHWYVKGMPPYGQVRTHHAHIIQTGEPFKRRIRFRDKLRSDLALRQQYEILKQQLAKNYSHDREAYTAAKSALITSVINT